MSKFSVLMSVYGKENPQFLIQALNSVFTQSVKAAEVILVLDGKLTKELDKVVDEYANKYHELKIVPLSENVGLGNALSEGLKRCSYDYVARMDTDDICVANRFEKQVEYLNAHPEIDIVGGNIAEFIDNYKNPVSFRKLPENHVDIFNFGKKRNPLNHMTVFFRRKSVEKVGGYLPFSGFEDYFLWARMLTSAMKFHNIQENLVYARIGNDMIGRRIGLDYVISEIQLFKIFVSLGFITSAEFLIIVPQRIFIRLLPKSAIKFMYDKFLRTE